MSQNSPVANRLCIVALVKNGRRWMLKGKRRFSTIVKVLRAEFLKSVLVMAEFNIVSVGAGRELLTVSQKSLELRMR